MRKRTLSSTSRQRDIAKLATNNANLEQRMVLAHRLGIDRCDGRSGGVLGGLSFNPF